MLERSLELHGAAAWAATSRPGAGCSGRSSARPSRCFRELLGPLRVPRHPLLAGPLRAQRPALGDRPRARALRGRARPRAARRLRRALDALAGTRRDRGASGSCSSPARTRSAGRSRAAARSGSPTRWSRSCDRSAATVETGRRVDSLDELDARRRAARRRPARAPAASPASGCRRATGADSSATATGPACSRSTGRSTAPIPWTRAEVARGGDRPPRRHARRDRRVRARREPRPAPRRARSCCSCSRASFDPTRAPAGKHTAWAYCHVPNGSTVDMTGGDRGAGRALRARLPRPDRRSRGDGHAPRSSATTRTTSAATSTAALQDLRQLFARPVARPNPYTTPLPGVFLCSASTPPGGGVHGMCG